MYRVLLRCHGGSPAPRIEAGHAGTRSAGAGGRGVAGDRELGQIRRWPTRRSKLGRRAGGRDEKSAVPTTPPLPSVNRMVYT